MGGDRFELFCGDSLEVLCGMCDCGIDAVVTDPPYGLSFMGKVWDRGIPPIPYWAELLRVSKPGAHLLAFGGTRTYHRLICSIEDAGWEVRDCLMWVYGEGFPKSHDVSKAIDKVVGVDSSRYRKDNANNNAYAAHCGEQWQGWGTALKPAWEPIVLARKPLEGTVAHNVMKWGVGGINVDGCRVGTEEIKTNKKEKGSSFTSIGKGEVFNGCPESIHQGRWPANLIHDGSWDVLGLFPEGAKGRASGYDFTKGNNDNPSHVVTNIKSGVHFGDSGSAARFFYCAKASKADRDEGCEGIEERRGACEVFDASNRDGCGELRTPMCRNHHPTVKPTALMRYLCRLVTPPNGLILDPFMGSGSTGKAAMLEGFRFIGIDKESEYVEIARRRIGSVSSR